VEEEEERSEGEGEEANHEVMFTFEAFQLARAILFHEALAYLTITVEIRPSGNYTNFANVPCRLQEFLFP
jgi:hypothetical protein